MNHGVIKLYLCDANKYCNSSDACQNECFYTTDIKHRKYKDNKDYECKIKTIKDNEETELWFETRN
mgnify:CR=1 FL=1